MTDRIAQKIAWWLPRRVVYWCAIRVMSQATVGHFSDQEVPDLTCVSALQRWES